MMKKIKGLKNRIGESCRENRELIIDATVQAQKYFSGTICLTYVLYFALISGTDHVLWGSWNKQHLYDLVIAAAAALNWLMFAKPLIKREQALRAGDSFVLLMLLLLAAGRSMGGGYVSYTLSVCTAMATVMLSLRPVRYMLLALIAMCGEICLNYHFIGSDLATGIYYGVDAFLIFAVTSCLNLLFALMRYRIFDETSALRKENALDGLTGLYNRRYLEHYFRFHHREGETAALIHMDLDNFKAVNDTLGHKEGDRLLVRVAEILRDNFRETDCVARVGGDEYMVFMPGLTDAQLVRERVERVLKRFPMIEESEGGAVPVSISIGVAVSGDSLSYLRFYEHADKAMYQAKRSGKGQAAFVDVERGETTVLSTARPDETEE